MEDLYTVEIGPVRKISQRGPCVNSLSIMCQSTPSIEINMIAMLGLLSMARTLRIGFVDDSAAGLFLIDIM